MIQNSQTGSSGAAAPRQLVRHPLTDYYAALIRKLQTAGNATGRKIRAVGIAGSAGGDGVSSICGNLAIAAAESGRRRVLLVDANLENPSLARMFSGEHEPGWIDVLSGDALQADCVQQTTLDTLALMPAGSARNNPAAFSDLDEIQPVLGQLTGEYDLVIFDLGVAGEFSSSLVLSSAVDGVLLVLEPARTRKVEARRAKQQLVEAGANLLGVILNKGG